MFAEDGLSNIVLTTEHSDTTPTAFGYEEWVFTQPYSLFLIP